MRNAMQASGSAASGVKYPLFALIGAMMAYVIWHNERFLLDAAHPVWQHYEPFKWWLLPHGVAGFCALILAPMQFSTRIRNRFLRVHRTVGGLYVAGALILAPVGMYIQYLDEAQGAARSFTLETMIQGGLLMTTALIGLYFALKRQITQHRQWMIRSYAVALTFFEIRLILGVTGWDAPPIDWHLLETTVWSCVAVSVLVGDIANTLYEIAAARPRAAIQRRRAA